MTNLELNKEDFIKGWEDTLEGVQVSGSYWYEQGVDFKPYEFNQRPRRSFQ